MRVVVIGATGFVGKEVVREALAGGHLVTAFARHTQRLTELAHPNLTCLDGDVLRPSDLLAATQGQEAVIATFSTANVKGTTVMSAGTRHLIQALHTNKVRRLISLSSAGVLGHDAPWLFTHLIVPLTLRHVFKDKRLQFHLVEQSGLDWTLVRPTEIVSEPIAGQLVVSHDTPKAEKIGVQAVAAFLVQQLAEPAYVHRAPIIAVNPGKAGHHVERASKS